MSNTNECQELKNIKYKTMLLSGTSTDITPSSGNTDTTNVDIDIRCIGVSTKPNTFHYIETTYFVC